MSPSTSSLRKADPQRWRAFTLVDLLAGLAVLALCTVVLLPALARTQPQTRAFQCLNNHAQLCRAWRLYAEDNNDRLATSIYGAGAMNPSQPIWAGGWLDWTSSADNTNLAYLANPRYAILAPYDGKDHRLFKCPADTFASTTQRAIGWGSRARSVSQNLYVANGNVLAGPTDAAYVQVTKLTGLLNPPPADNWVSLDEHPDSINDAGFFAPSVTSWTDLPASYHDGGAGLAFADGHTELHRWQTSVLVVPITYTGYSGISRPPGDPDIAWLRYRTPRKAGAN